MLDKIIAYSLRQKLIVLLMVLALVIWGIYETLHLPIDAVPDITDNQVQIITVTPGLGTADAERLVTFPIEQACSNISGIKELRSFSRFGLSLVTVVFNDETDVYWARQQIAERLQLVQAEIPSGSGTPFMAPVTTGLGEIYQYVVRPKPGYEKVYNARELRTIQDWTVRRALLGTEGVADVSSFGGYLKQYVVAVKPDQLKASGVSIEDVYNALERNNQNTGGAYIERGPTALFIRTEGLVGSENDIANIIVRTSESGSPILIKDVANVTIGNAVRYGAMCYNDQGEVSGAVVMMLKGENSSAVIERVKFKIEEIKKQLPEGVTIEPFLDRTKMVGHAIGTVEENLAMAGIIVVFVLVFFFGSFRAGLVVASVIPLAMLFAIIMMNQFGVSGNLMSLGAIDFGLIVDGAVIIVEAVIHRISHRKGANTFSLSSEQMDEEVKHSSSKMMNSALFGQIIILIVYLPILSLQGIEGKMFKPMAQTVALAIVGAILLSLTYVPVASSLFLSKKVDHKLTMADRIMLFLQVRYEKLLTKVLQIPKTVIALAIAFFVLSVFILSQMGGEFIPELEEGDFAMDSRVLVGSNLNTSIEYTQKASKILLEKFPEVEKVVTKIGSGEIPTDPMPIEASDVMIILKDKSEWTSAETFDELAEKMTHELSVIPGMTVGFQYPVQMRFNELMTGARQDVVCKIFGENLDTLALYADKITKIAETVPGAVEFYTERITGVPQIVVNYDRANLAKYQLSINEVNRTINAAFAGQQAGLVFEGEKRFDLVVRLHEQNRRSLSDVQNLLLPTPSGQQIPLYTVAKVEEVLGPNQIQRENAHRRIVVGFNVRGRDVESIVDELRTKVGAAINLPSGYSVQYGGSFENLQQAKERLSIAIPLALLMIFVLLYFTFRNLTLGLLVFSAIPLSAIGGVLALFIRQMPFSISAGVGFIALFGIAVLDGIVLIAKFTELKNEGKHDLKGIIMEGTRVRLRPVLIAALVPALGFLPMAISNGAGAEVQRPLATVVIGGLISSTLLTLLVLPVLYKLTMRKSVSKASAVAPVATALVLLFASQGTNAQRNLELNEALAMAKTNNLALQAQNQRVSANHALLGTAFNPDPLALGSEWGQVNSFYQDNRFTANQSFNLPGVYRKQRSVLMMKEKVSSQELQLLQMELDKEIKSIFYRWQILEERYKLLLRNDSLFEAYKKSYELKLAAGDESQWAVAIAANQQLEVSNELAALDIEKTELLQNFNMLLGSTENCAPATVSSRKYSPNVALQFNALNHSAAALANAQKELSVSELALSKTNSLPTITIGYYNMSIVGWQRINDTDRSFGKGSRFSTYAGGLTIPLFQKSYRAQKKAAQFAVKESEILSQLTVNKLQWAYQSQLNRFNKLSESINRFETDILPNGRKVLQAAQAELANGNITQIEFVLMNTQVFQSELKFLNTLQLLNEAAIELEYLSSTQPN